MFTAMTERDFDADLSRAVAYLDAVETPDGDWAYYASETRSWWVCSPYDIAGLSEYLDSDDPAIRSDAYSHWCAQSSADEMPPEWRLP